MSISLSNFESSPLYFDNIEDDNLIDRMYQSMTPIMETEDIEKLPKKPMPDGTIKCPSCKNGCCTMVMSNFIEVEYDDDILIRTTRSHLQRCFLCKKEWYEARLPQGVNLNDMKDQEVLITDDGSNDLVNVIIPSGCIKKITVKYRAPLMENTDVSADDSADASKKQKKRWCVVM